ncbi:murein hydrolase activator EnvC family protein [Brevundimonas sp.]|jgi:septal ring factor EnvC (AmiA/AmiB activator)|uniref:murein hydrolase activator EnvC family protein n=1 Tax=Brevundimonas sp. TaxID=1871086 RepID=UPI00391B2A4A
MKRFALLAAILLAALPASAAVQEDLEQLQARYRDEQVRARRLRADAEAAQGELAALDRELATLQRDVASGDQELSAQRARLAALGRREAAIVSELARARDSQMRLLSALQLMSRRPPPPLLISADRAVDTVRAAILMKAMAPDLRARADALAARQAEVGRIRRLAVLSSERLMTTESAQGDRRAEIESLSARRTALLAVLRADADRAERAARSLEARIRALGATPESAAEAADAPASRLPAGRNRLTAPVPGSPSVRFGQGGDGARSQGWRWSASGDVAAPAGARVDHAGPLSGWGEVVILDLGDGWRAVLAGLDTIAVEPGQRVADSQTLGRAEAGGEVYLELRRGDRPVDPAPFF